MRDNLRLNPGASGIEKFEVGTCLNKCETVSVGGPVSPVLRGSQLRHDIDCGSNPRRARWDRTNVSVERRMKIERSRLVLHVMHAL